MRYYRFFNYPVNFIYCYFFIINIKVLKLNVIFMQYDPFLIYPINFIFYYSIILLILFLNLNLLFNYLIYLSHFDSYLFFNYVFKFIQY